MSASDGSWAPLANDDRGANHGPFADRSGGHLIMHSTRSGRRFVDVDGRNERPLWNLWELPLDESRPRLLEVPGHAFAGHGTRALNGVLTFDSPSEYREVTRAG